MIQPLPPWASRALAVLLLFAGAGLVYLVTISPLLADYAGTQQSIAQMQTAIEHYRRVAAELPARRAILANLRSRQATSEGFLQGTNDSLVAAQIQNRIKALVEAAHGELKSTQVLQVQEEGKYRRVTVRAQMALDLGAAQQVIYGIETASPLLFLDSLDMRSRIGGRYRDGAEDGALDLRLDVYGYMRGEAAADRQSAAAANPAAAGN